MIIGQAMTLGKGTAGLGASTAGPDGSLYTSQAQTGLANNGYGAIASGTQLPDTDNDGMSDDWERANGSDPKADDAMKKAPSGYTLIERYLNWLAAPHATTTAGAGGDLDLSTYAAGFSAVAPTYDVAGAQNGAVSLGADKHSAHFQPNPGFHGLGAFAFSVTGSDGTAFTTTALVLVTP